MSSPVHDLAKTFFGFGENPGVIKIILPSVSQKRGVSLRCANYPLFEYEISPDDMFSAIRVYSLLTSIYGEIVELYSHNEIIIKPGYNQIFVGGPPTNSFIYHALKNAPIHFGESNVNRIIHGKKGSYEIGFSSPDPGSRWITEDYSLLSRRKKNQNIELIISGLRAYGQLATYEFLNEEKFYCDIQDLLDCEGFQVLVKITVQGKACVEWKVIEKVKWDNSTLENSIIPGKRLKGEYDVFLSYNSKDEKPVKEIAEKLKQRDILPWLDKDDLLPGMDWQETLERQIRKIKSAIVFFGKHGEGPWQHQEIQAFVRELVKRKCPVIPAILPDCEGDPILPLFLESKVRVDFRDKDIDAIEQLRMGILSAPASIKESV